MQNKSSVEKEPSEEERDEDTTLVEENDSDQQKEKVTRAWVRELEGHFE